MRDRARTWASTYRYVWEPVGRGRGLRLRWRTARVRAAVPRGHHGAHDGTDYPSTVNELTLTPTTGGTLLSLVITYPNAEVRDMVLATGMTDGMETSYVRLEGELVDA